MRAPIGLMSKKLEQLLTPWFLTSRLTTKVSQETEPKRQPEPKLKLLVTESNTNKRSMVSKNRLLNWHRKAYAEERYNLLPNWALLLLQEQEAEKEREYYTHELKQQLAEESENE